MGVLKGESQVVLKRNKGGATQEFDTTSAADVCAYAGGVWAPAVLPAAGGLPRFWREIAACNLHQVANPRSAGYHVLQRVVLAALGCLWKGC